MLVSLCFLAVLLTRKGLLGIQASASPGRTSGEAGIELSTTDLALLLTGVDLASARRRKRYAHAG
jgi:hypothetical protein